MQIFGAGSRTRSGRIDTRAASDRIYNARMDASNCDNTNQFIQNFSYPGYAFVTSTSGGGSRLHFIGASAANNSALAFVATSGHSE